MTITTLSRLLRKESKVQSDFQLQSTHTMVTKAEENGPGSSTTDDNYDEQSLLTKQKSTT